ncbi:helix-turn-helix transcriptional regulator [Alteribacillus sp. HJP-4]|uniref:helix-turn-helix transcriptional regulator n=1 Tax=Alteribacillus sp. HJP-4 TaxID=2775394 RepID=UPI0035CCD540
MKAERMIKILILLQYGEVLPTSKLADELEVSQRTIHRDMEALSAIGIPVYAERGKAGGWRLVDDWKQRLSWFKEKEILSFFLPPSEKILSDLNLDISRTDLINKLLVSLPEQSRKNAQHLWERIYVDMGTWRSSATQTNSVLEVLQKTVMEEQIVHILYKKGSGERKEYRIKPLGLVAKGSSWYAAALNEHDELRSYRVSRILETTLTEEHFTRPGDFHLPAYWESSKQSFIQKIPEFHVKVTASSKAYQRIVFTGHFVQIKELQKVGGWTEVELTFPTEEEAVHFLIGFGREMKVISPKSVICKIINRAEEVLDLYEV